MDTSDDEINDSLIKLEGDSLPGFPSPDTFEMLISPHLTMLLQPSLDLLEEI
jgi:dynamin 1-like protein